MKESHRWNHLADAVKQVERSHPETEGLDAPLGFTTRVSSLAMGQRKEHLLGLWKRWSLLAAASSLALMIIALLSAGSNQELEHLFPVLEVEYPASIDL